MPCFSAYARAAVSSRAATADTSASGCSRAGTIRALGAILAAPRMPKRRGWVTCSTLSPSPAECLVWSGLVNYPRVVTTVNIQEAKTHLSRLLERAQAGERIIIAKAGVPVAELRAVTRPDIVFGRYAGEIDVDYE